MTEMAPEATSSTRKPIGILGDGQLALMLGESAQSLGVPFLIYGESKSSSCARRFPEAMVYGENTLEALAAFAERCEVLTLENEFLSADLLAEISTKSKTPIVPDPESYAYFDHKISQRRFYQELGIASPEWSQVKSASPAVYPCVLKTSQGGYDGYGVRVVRSEFEWNQALADFGFAESRAILQEELVEIQHEFAQGAVFDGKGGLALLPLVETVQREGTCILVYTRPAVSADVLSKVREKTESALKKMASADASKKLKGLFNFEFFYTRSGEVWINEGAPRPHNSQHITLNASPQSQFDALVQFLIDGDLSRAQINKPQAAVMVNLLGRSTGADYRLVLPRLPETLEVHEKLYLKTECRPGRKMGHLNLVDPSGTLDLHQIGEQVFKEYQL